MNNYLKNGYKNKITIKEGDENQIESVNNFLTQLENDFINFKEEYNQKLKEYLFWSESKKEDERKTFFIPESLTKKSALTIIDAKWGSGKTYFVENVLKNIELGEANGYFEHGIMVDAWRLSLSNDVIAELFSEIIYSLIRLNSTSETKAAIKSIAGWIYDMSKPIWTKKQIIEKTSGIEITRSQYLDALEKIEGKIKPTLIFIDNLERVGRESWDIIKSASRLLAIENIVIVLPINLSKMHKVYDEIYDAEKSSEISIEKYLDIKYYELSQDYLGLLEKLEINKEIAEKINEWLLLPKNERILSIREVKHRIEGNDLNKLDDNLEVLGYFNKYIWDNNEKMINWAYKKYEEIDAEIKEFSSNIDEKINISENELEIWKDLNRSIFEDFFTKLKNTKTISEIVQIIKNHKSEIENWSSLIVKKRKDLEIEILTINTMIGNCEKNIKYLEKENKKLRLKWSETEGIISDLKEKLTEIDGIKEQKKIEQKINISIGEREIISAQFNNNKNDIEKDENEISKLRTQIYNLEEDDYPEDKDVISAAAKILSILDDYSNYEIFIKEFNPKSMVHNYLKEYVANPGLPLNSYWQNLKKEIDEKFLA